MISIMLQKRAIDVSVVNMSLDCPALPRMSFFYVLILSKLNKTNMARMPSTKVVNP